MRKGVLAKIFIINYNITGAKCPITFFLLLDIHGPDDKKVCRKSNVIGILRYTKTEVKICVVHAGQATKSDRIQNIPRYESFVSSSKYFINDLRICYFRKEAENSYDARARK